jgi:hypothetical protein
VNEDIIKEQLGVRLRYNGIRKRIAHIVSCARGSGGGDEFLKSDVRKQIVCHSAPRFCGVASLFIDTTLSRLYSIRVKEEESCMHEQG